MIFNAKAIIEDYDEGRIDRIIFESYGCSRDRKFFIIHPEKLAYEIGRDLCDNNDELNIDDITWALQDATEEIRNEIGKFLIEYIENNFEKEYYE